MIAASVSASSACRSSTRPPHTSHRFTHRPSRRMGTRARLALSCPERVAARRAPIAAVDGQRPLHASLRAAGPLPPAGLVMPSTHARVVITPCSQGNACTEQRGLELVAMCSSSRDSGLPCQLPALSGGASASRFGIQGTLPMKPLASPAHTLGKCQVTCTVHTGVTHSSVRSLSLHRARAATPRSVVTMRRGTGGRVVTCCAWGGVLRHASGERVGHGRRPARSTPGCARPRNCSSIGPARRPAWGTSCRSACDDPGEHGPDGCRLELQVACDGSLKRHRG